MLCTAELKILVQIAIPTRQAVLSYNLGDTGFETGGEAPASSCQTIYFR